MDMIVRDCDYLETGIDWIYCEDCLAVTKWVYNRYGSQFSLAKAWRNNELLGLRGTICSNLSDFYQVIEKYK
jgi:hypothetical protein|nr:MAG TPA: hypothetical protein [Caudoviricetes sp.]